jgi:prepilin-type N-terminal cleavage/methylation domain-containing protein
MSYLKTITKQARQRGTTLIELSVVIAVILLLVGVLFIGITAWKNGANKAACILNIGTAQKAYRGYQNMNSGAGGVPPDPAMTDLITAGFFATPGPVCPSGGTYTFIAAPAVGTVWMVCSKAAAPDLHVPTSFANW